MYSYEQPQYEINIIIRNKHTLKYDIYLDLMVYCITKETICKKKHICVKDFLYNCNVNPNTNTLSNTISVFSLFVSSILFRDLRL